MIARDASPVGRLQRDALGDETRRRSASRALALLLAVLVAVPPVARTDPPPERDPLDAAARAADSLHPALYDVGALADLLGAGVERPFQFVRDRIRWEPYRGILRGSDGTLAARAGNAWDRALLLAALLDEQGITVRYAVGRLDAKGTARLLARVFEPSAAGTPAASPGDASPRPDEPALFARVRRRAARDHAAVLAALGDRRPTGGGTRDEALADLAEHVWVQARVGDVWTDLDPSFADAEPGKPAAAVERTLDAPDAAAFQTVTVRLVAETLEGGALQRRTYLEMPAAAADVIDRPLFVVHLPPTTPGIADALGGAIEAAQSKESWIPALRFDGRMYAGQPVPFAESEVKSARGRPPAGGLGGLLGRGGALAGGGGPLLVAEWLEVEATAPDGAHRTSRRALVDRASAAWRAAAEKDATALQPLQRQGDVLVAPRETHVLWLTAGPHDLRSYAYAVESLLYPVARPADGEEPSGLAPLAALSAALVVYSDHLVVPSLNDRSGCHFHAALPRVSLISVGPAPSAPAGMSRWRVDLLEDSIRGVAKDPADEPEVAARKLWFGLLEGALEHEFCAMLHENPDATADKVTSTSALVAESALVALDPAAHPSGPMRPEIEALLSAAPRDTAVLVPRAALASGRLAWIEVDRDGTVRTRMAEGLRGGESRLPAGGVIPADPLAPSAPGGTRPPGPPSWVNRGMPDGWEPPPRIPPPPWDGPVKPPPARPPWWRNVSPPKPGAPQPQPPYRLNPPPGSGPGVASPRFPPGASTRASGPNKKKREGGGNEYLLVVLQVSVVIVLSVLLAYGPLLISQGSQWLAHRVTQILRDALDADPARR